MNDRADAPASHAALYKESEEPLRCYVTLDPVSATARS